MNKFIVQHPLLVPIQFLIYTDVRFINILMEQNIIKVAQR